jgi:4-carboxymuconolactone decarboxylase
MAHEVVSTAKDERAPMLRIPDLDEAALSPEQKKVYDAIVAGPRGAVRGPLRIWLHSAALAERAQDLGAFCRYHSSLPPRLSELAILVVAAFWRAGYEWAVHAPQALAAGIEPSAIDAIRQNRSPHLEQADAAAVYAFARELLESRQVREETYRKAAAELGDRGVVDLVGVLGYYGLVSMTIAAFKVLPDGQDPFA